MDEMEPGPVMVGRVSLLIVELGFLERCGHGPTACSYRVKMAFDSEVSSSASSDYAAVTLEA